MKHKWFRQVSFTRWPFWGRALGAGRAWLSFQLDAEWRGCLTDNLAAAFPEKSPRQIRQLARNVCLTIERNQVDQRHLEILSDAEISARVANLEIRGRSHIEEHYLAGRPIILVTPHYGSYMLAARCVAAEFSKNGLYFFYNPPEKNSYAESSNRLLDRPDSGCHKIYNNAHGIKTALKALRSGGILCMMPDLVSVTASSLYVPFFGRFFTAMAGTAFLALRARAVVVPAYCYPDKQAGGRTILEFRSPLKALDQRGGDADERVYSLTAELFAELERQIRCRPEHWKYWHVFLKRSLTFPLPAPSRNHLLGQLRDQRTSEISREDFELRTVIEECICDLDRERSSPGSLI